MQTGQDRQNIGSVPFNAPTLTGTERKPLTALAGGAQVGATQIKDGVAEINTVATANDSVMLPTANGGKVLIVTNSSLNPCQCFGAGIDTINDIANATGISLPAKSVTIFGCISSSTTATTASVALAGEWYALTTLYGTAGIGTITSSTVAVGSAVSLTSTTTANVTSITGLTPGNYDVQGVVDWHAGGATTTTTMIAGIGATTATVGAQDTFTNNASANTLAAASDMVTLTPIVRVAVTATTQVIYLVANAVFGVSTLAVYGSVRATRVS